MGFRDFGFRDLGFRVQGLGVWGFGVEGSGIGASEGPDLLHPDHSLLGPLIGAYWALFMGGPS